MNKELTDKIKKLKDSGLNVNVISKDDKYVDGYILGKMKDSHKITKL